VLARRGGYFLVPFVRGVHLVLRLRVMHLLLLGYRLQMRVEQRYFRLQFGLDPGQFNFGLRFHLLMDPIVLCPLLYEMRALRTAAAWSACALACSANSLGSGGGAGDI
jgi:hypothetical protein